MTQLWPFNFSAFSLILNKTQMNVVYFTMNAIIITYMKVQYLHETLAKAITGQTATEPTR